MRTNRTTFPGYDVSVYGARKRINQFIFERLYTGRMPVFHREKEALEKDGHNPEALILADRIGDTSIFFRVSISAPILVNERGEVLDLNEPTPKH